MGIGVNVAIDPADFPPELRDTAGTLGLEPDAIEPTLDELLGALERWLSASDSELLDAVRARDALLGRPVRVGRRRGSRSRDRRRGPAAGRDGGGVVALDAGEVHLQR